MKKYFITLFALFCFQMAQGQVDNDLVYHEYDPDFWVVVTEGNHYDVDIDDDGTPDVKYEVYCGNKSRTYSYVNTINGWENCSYCLYPYDSYFDNFFYGLSVTLNDTSLIWGSVCHFEALVQPLVYKVALRYRDGENYYYGWAEFEEIREAYYSRGRFHVAQTCFCAIPNYPLHWGQTSLTEDIEENAENVFAILFPNPTNGQVTITGQSLKSVEVFNPLGQRVVMVQGEGGQMTVDVSGLPAGLYFVNISDEEGRKCVRKVVKK